MQRGSDDYHGSSSTKLMNSRGTVVESRCGFLSCAHFPALELERITELCQHATYVSSSSVKFDILLFARNRYSLVVYNEVFVCISGFNIFRNFI